MSASEQADLYFQLFPQFAEELGGLRWSHGCDALELASGQTVAFAMQLQAILTGLLAERKQLPRFDYLAAALVRCKVPPSRTGLASLELLREVYTAAGPLSSGSNLGALLAELLADFPTVPNPPSAQELCETLDRRMSYGERHRPELLQQPSMTLAEFEVRLNEKLQRFSRADLQHWLKFGTAPVPPPPEWIEDFPSWAAALHRVARQRERLAAADQLARVLEGAFHWPRRHPTPDPLPQGGYADVTTRGPFDRLLPSQFALDSDEFLRRFAEHELLYFEREQPHEPTSTERWLVLDLGVRTWGRPRLALAGAALAMLGQDPLKHGSPRLLTTHRCEVLDPVKLSPRVVADELEASDMTPNPAEALRAVLNPSKGAADTPRDIILLTHPRSWNEPEIQSLFGRFEPSVRLFGLTVAESGVCELLLWKPSGTVLLQRIQLNLQQAEADADRLSWPASSSGTVGSHGSPWTGDIEPIGFPFSGGLIADVNSLLAFDRDDRFLMLVSKLGIPQLVHLDTATIETLPRGYASLQVLDCPLGVVSVRDGFMIYHVVARGPLGADGRLFVVHYFVDERRVRVVDLGPLDTMPMKVYSEANLAVAYSLKNPIPHVRCEFRNGVWEYGLIGNSLATLPYGIPPPFGRIAVNSALVNPTLEITASLSESGELRINNTLLGTEPWPLTCPREDGRPLFPNAVLTDAFLSGEVVACAYRSKSSRRGFLAVIHGPTSSLLYQTRFEESYGFALSPSGKRLFLQKGSREGEVRTVQAGGGRRQVYLPNGGFHNNLEARLLPKQLLIRVGQHRHCFSWESGTWVASYQQNDKPLPRGEKRTWHGGTTKYDLQRFRVVDQFNGLVVVQDSLGQVVLLHERTGHVVAQVLIRRDLAAAVLPDGTRWAQPGSEVLIGSSPDPDAARQLGTALLGVSG